MGDILKSQIKLMSSEVLSDTGDGGGQMTSNEIVSGNVNNAFPDSSRLDKTYGRVSLRKAFLAVQTDNRACYYGSHIALVEQAKDPLISVCLFTTEDWFDTREDCKTRIEGYLVKGPFFPCGLWGDHYSGSKAIQVFVEEDWDAPKTGEVLVLITNKNLDGQSISQKEQFARITEVKEELRELTENNEKFTKKIINITFSDKLLFDLPGTSPKRNFRYSSGLPTTVYTSVAADTSTYYGVSKLSEIALKNDLQIKVDEIRKPLVPSAQVQSAITDFGVGMAIPAVLKTSKTNTITKNFIYENVAECHSGFAIVPESLILLVAGNTFTDNGKGILFDQNNSSRGTVDYGAGIIFFNTLLAVHAHASLTAIPAVSHDVPTETGSIKIEEQNRGYVYVFNCTPVPEKGTLRIDYMSGGKWYSLFDQGTGELRGLKNGIGSGTINFDSGSVAMTLGGLPDTGSNILVYWGTAMAVQPVEGMNPGTLKTIIELEIEDYPKAGTLNIQIKPEYKIYETNGNELFFGNTVTGNSGVVGKRIGRELKFTIPELDMTTATVFPVKYIKYNAKEKVVRNINALISENTVSYTLPGSDQILPKTFQGKYPLVVQSPVGYEPLQSRYLLYFHDDGNGNLVETHSTSETPVVVGSIDYTTRAITLKRSVNRSILCYQYGFFIKIKRLQAKEFKELLCEYVGLIDQNIINSPNRFEVTYIPDMEGETNCSENITASPTYIIKKPESAPLIAGSVTFESDSNIFCDLGTGYIKNLETEELAFKINYSTGKLTPTSSFSGYSAGLQKIAGLATYEKTAGVYFWTFRCPGVPITPGSFTIQATKLDGKVISATAAFDGKISAPGISGTINFTTGIVLVMFGDWVPKSEHAGEAWVNDAPRDENGNVFKFFEKGIQSSTIIMNCVVQTYMPLDSKLLGLNPVKLPVDGKVPIFRDGGIVLIHHSQTTVVASPTPGQVVNVRLNTNLIELYDNNGVYIPEVGNYSVDLSAGTITFEDPLDLAGYSAPFQVFDRIEDMVLATDVQITGHIAVSQPLQHDYPTDDPDNPTLVSSVLPIGDMQSRIYNEFTDSSWNNKWLDIPQYNPTTAKYDLVNYPVIVTNKGAVKERFACIFTAGNKVNVVGEHLGVILANAPVTTDIAPVNPATGQPYFRIRHEGWGSGWSSGQVFRFNSDAANFPVWFCRTTQQGPATENDDHFTIQMRGDSA